MAPSGDPPTDRTVSQPEPKPARPLGSSCGRAGARWMVDPEAIWRPAASGRTVPAAYAVVITDAVVDAGTGHAMGVGPAGPRIRQTDAGFARMTGYTHEAVNGLTLDVLAGPVTDRGRLAAAFACLAAGHPDAGATVQYRRDGTPFGMAWSAEPVRVDATGIALCAWVLHEIDIDRPTPKAIVQRPCNRRSSWRRRACPRMGTSESSTSIMASPT